MTSVILLVTWLVPGQPANSYQVPFTTKERCAAARTAVLQDAQRLLDERATGTAPSGPRIQPTLAFGITALCVTQ